MGIEPRQALYAHLKNDPGVQAAIGERIYQRRAPAGAEKPLILIQPQISRIPSRDLGGTAFKRVRLQVTAIADTQTQAEVAVRAVDNAVEGFSGSMAAKLQTITVTVDNDRQVEQEEIGEIYHHVDITIIYKE